MPVDISGSSQAVRALDCFPERHDATEPITIAPLGRGLINETHLVTGTAAPLVLQQVSPIFDPAIHHNIEAVTSRLAAAGLATPRLRPTRDGQLWADLGTHGVWRLMTHVAGTSFDVAQSTAQAAAAGALVARFHGALADLDHDFVGRRLGVHDTAAHLARLKHAVAQHRGHRLHAAVVRLADDIQTAQRKLPPLPDLEPRPCHGDLKLNNLRFAGPEPPASAQAICLIDLDTLGPMSLAHELGDAWRSWCNRAGENATEAHFDLAIFAASWEGYRRHGGDQLDRAEREGLLLGVDWICLELSARFATDALEERYFGWDPQRHQTRGDHNLERARGQLALHRAAVHSRPERARLLGIAG